MILKRKGAFTLAEMMVVLLILSIITAAFVPIMTKKAKQTSASASQLWHLVDSGSGAGSDIYSDTIGTTQGAAIGANNLGGESAKLLINTAALGQNHVVFKENTNTMGRLVVDSLGNVGLGGVSFNAATPTNKWTTGVGFSVTASGMSSTALGSYTVASGPSSMALGNCSNATASSAIAVGRSAGATGANTVALGEVGVASADYANAMGYYATASGDSSVAIGKQTIASGANTIALGVSSNTKGATGSGSITIGNNTTDTGAGNSVVIGAGSYVTGYTYSGNSNIAIGNSAHVEGQDSIAIGTYAHASNTYYSGNPAITIGDNSYATGSNSMALGSQAHATHSEAVAIGVDAVTTADKSITLGRADDTVYISGQLHVGNVNREETTVTGGWETIVAAPDSAKPHGWLLFRSNCDSVSPSWQCSGTPSDRRIKTLKGPSVAGLEELRKLKVYNYIFTKDSTKNPRVGVMAQDLQKIFPHAVNKGKDGYFRIRQEDMFYAMMNAVKELDTMVQGLVKKFQYIVARVQTLDDKVIALIKVNQIQAKKIKELEARLTKLEKQIKH